MLVWIDCADRMGVEGPVIWHENEEVHPEGSGAPWEECAS